MDLLWPCISEPTAYAAVASCHSTLGVVVAVYLGFVGILDFIRTISEKAKARTTEEHVLWLFAYFIGWFMGMINAAILIASDQCIGVQTIALIFFLLGMLYVAWRAFTIIPASLHGFTAKV